MIQKKKTEERDYKVKGEINRIENKTKEEMAT